MPTCSDCSSSATGASASVLSCRNLKCATRLGETTDRERLSEGGTEGGTRLRAADTVGTDGVCFTWGPPHP